MKIDAAKLPAELKRGLKPLYVINGIEPLAALEAADLIRAAAKKAGCEERRVFSVESGFDWSAVTAVADALSLFASRRLIELRIPTGKPGVEGGKTLMAYANHLSPDDITLIVLPEMDWRAQQAEWFNALDAAGVVIEAKPVAREQLPAWLADRLALQNQSADADTLDWMASQVEGNMLAAFQEVQKLALLAPAGGLSREQVEAAVTDVARYDLDTLVGAVLDRDAARISRIMDALRAEQEPENLVLWQLTDLTRTLATLAKGGFGGRRYPPDRQRALEALARGHSVGSLARLLQHAHRIDRTIKGVETGDAWQGLHLLAERLAGVPSLSAQAA